METLKERDYITNVIKTICEDQGIENYEITNVRTNQKGDGFLAEFFMVTVKDTDSAKELNFAIKAAFTEDNIRETFPIRSCFENEIYFYSTVYNIFKTLEKEKQVSENVQFIPKCLKVSVSAQRELLVLENITFSGFEVFEKTSFLDDDHVRMIFKTYGRFHAYSFAMRDQKPEEFEKLNKPIHNVYDQFFNDKDGSFRKYYTKFGQEIEKYLIPGEDDEIITMYHNLYGADGFSKAFEKLVNEKCNYPALLHGDCWSNNMMFKYEKTPDKRILTDMRLIDWQLIKIGSPACDLAYCLYSGTSVELYKDLDKYLRIYHDSFSSFLNELGSNPEKLYPFEALKDDWRKYAKFGMFMGLDVMKVKLTNKEDVLDFSDALDFEEFNKSLENVRFDEARFGKIARDLIRHLYELNAL